MKHIKRALCIVAFLSAVVLFGAVGSLELNTITYGQAVHRGTISAVILVVSFTLIYGMERLEDR